MKLRCVLLFLLALLVHTTVARADWTSGKPLGLQLEILEDSSRSLTPETVLKDSRWKRSDHEAPSFGFTRSAFWFRFEVAEDACAKEPCILQVDYPPLDRVEIWRIEQGIATHHQLGGDQQPFAVRALRLPAVHFQLDGPGVYLGRVESTSSVSMPMSLWSRTELLNAQASERAILGAFFGIMAVMLLYNGLLWVRLRERTYRNYCLYVATFLLFEASVEGWTFQYLWPGSPFLAQVVTPMSLGLMIASMTWFSVDFLELRKRGHWAARWSWPTAGTAVAIGLASAVIPYSVSIRLLAVVGILCLVVSTASGIDALRVRQSGAVWFSVGYGSLLLGLFVYTARALGLLSSHVLPVHAPKVGALLDVVLLSLALADRIKRLQAEATGHAERARESSEQARLATERALADQERVNRELQRLDRLKDEFLANMSHELRTPINGTMGLAEGLLEQADQFPPRAVQSLRTILASGKRLDRLISDLLDFSKAQAGQLQVSLGPVDLYGAASEAILLLSSSVGNKQLRLVNSVPTNFPLARGDDVRVAQVLGHLVSNAIKFTEYGEVRLGAERRNGLVVVTVKDTGPGIPEEKRSALFRSFEQVDGSSTRLRGGTGLGLALVQKLVQLQGGDVWCESTVGLGSTFSFTLAAAGPGAQRKEERVKVHSIPPRLAGLPMDSPGRLDLATSILPVLRASTLWSVEAKPHDSSPASQTWAVGQGRILVADDEPINLDRMRLDLEPLGYELVTVTDGSAAIEAFKQQGPFDIVFLDVMMPRQDGFTTCRRLRELAPANLLPVVLVTAKREPKDLQEGFAAGATDFLTKPYVRQELLARTKAHLGTARLSRAFHRHVPVEFAKLLGHEGAEGLRLGDCVERQLTVFFADIQGFTKASERMTSRQVFAWLNDCFSLIVPALRAHGGLVDKYIGDAVMAVFAASADHAVEAAIDATRALRQLDPKLRLGIGLHYGEAMIGTLGDADRFAPTVVSDTVNVASRLETMTRRFGARVLLTEETLQAMEAASRHSFRYIGTFRVKGRQKALRVHEALDAEPDGVAQSRGNATECLREVHEALARVDLETAWVAAKRGTEKFPDDGVLSFLAGEVEDLVSGGAGDAFDGVLELRTK